MSIVAAVQQFVEQLATHAGPEIAEAARFAALTEAYIAAREAGDEPLAREVFAALAAVAS